MRGGGGCALLTLLPTDVELSRNTDWRAVEQSITNILLVSRRTAQGRISFGAQSCGAFSLDVGFTKEGRHKKLNI
jgi:hypothetical protein